MKKKNNISTIFLIITIVYLCLILFSKCITSKKSKPCKQCPHFSQFNPLFLERVKLNPYPTNITCREIKDYENK